MNVSKVKELINDLGWDFDRMSSSGQETYNKLCDEVGIEKFDEYSDEY
jgi:hypothetical protein